MNTSVAVTCVFIVLARITDVTLDTLRTASIVQGRRLFSAVLGFIQAVIYITAIAKVLLNMDHPVYALAYGLGYGLGTFLGITIEQRLAFGHQLASLITKRGVEMARALMAAGHHLAMVQGHIRDGEAAILYVEVPRKQVQKLIRDVGTIDENCFCVVNDVRVAGLLARNKNLEVSGQAANAENMALARRIPGRAEPCATDAEH
jgi:uncharacterized protein YebE (UPF0316 family)